MIENSFFPCLRNLDNSKGDLYHINMVYDETIVDSIPVITFVNDSGSKSESVRDVDEHGITGSQLVKSAFQNLRKVDINWETINTEGCRVLFVDNQKYAAEKILDKDFLKGTATYLNADEIIVGVPVQGAILCCDATDSKSLELLKLKLMNLYNDFSRSQISKLVFHIKDGIIEKNELVTLDEQAPQLLEDYPDGYEHSVSEVQLFSEIYMIKIIVGSANIKDLLNGMFVNIHNVLVDNKRKKDFNGAIEIQSTPDQPEKNMEHVNAIRDFFKRLKDNPTIQKACQKHVEKITISFLFGTDFQKGNVHKKIKILLT